MRTMRAALICATALMLGACGSDRFGGGSPRMAAAARPGPVFNAPEPLAEPAPVISSGPVSSAPLPPPPGSPGPLAGDPALPPATGPVIADVPAMPPPVQPQAPIQVAAVAPAGRSAVMGGWTAREASGSCRVQLSSSPALDLYKASAAGCSNRDLSRVTAWDFREGEVYLYQPGGAVAARLRPAGGALEGVIAKSGAPLTLAR